MRGDQGPENRLRQYTASAILAARRNCVRGVDIKDPAFLEGEAGPAVSRWALLVIAMADVGGRKANPFARD